MLLSLHLFPPYHCSHTYHVVNKAYKVDSALAGVTQFHTTVTCWKYSLGPVSGSTLIPSAHICWSTEVCVKALHLSEAQGLKTEASIPVSYTHLTLPTILLV